MLTSSISVSEMKDIFLYMNGRKSGAGSGVGEMSRPVVLNLYFIRKEVCLRRRLSLRSGIVWRAMVSELEQFSAHCTHCSTSHWCSTSQTCGDSSGDIRSPHPEGWRE